MEKQDIKIKSISIEQYKCFKDVQINCTKEDSSVYQWTVLLGNNNTGKTSLLKAIAELRAIEEIMPDNTKSYLPALKKSFLDVFDKSINCKVSCQFLPSINNKWFYGYTFQTIIRSSSPDLENFKIYGYGVSRYPSQTSLSDSLCEDCDSLLDPNTKLINIEEWLLQLDYSNKNGNAKAGERLEKIRTLFKGNLFPEISDFKFETTDEFHNYTLFETIDGWYRYTDMGHGCQLMLSWVVDLCKRMFDRYPNSQEPLKESAIVLVDEIDLHLHPQWQRDIIAFLSNVFPKVQFIVTTHSPMVIQSMGDVNLYVLKREGKEVKVEKSDTTNFTGWTVEEILRETMDMDDKTHSNTYKELISQFDDGLDDSNIAQAQKAYNDLIKILHPNNPTRQLLEMQLKLLKQND